MPYVKDGLTGAIVGALLATAILVAWHLLANHQSVVPTVRRESIPERVRHEVWRRDKGRCVDCGGRERLEFDHIIPVSRGGSNTARNIELRCVVCNRRKGARI